MCLGSRTDNDLDNTGLTVFVEIKIVLIIVSLQKPLGFRNQVSDYR
jgi:hypothetical protein